MRGDGYSRISNHGKRTPSWSTIVSALGVLLAMPMALTAADDSQPVALRVGNHQETIVIALDDVDVVATAGDSAAMPTLASLRQQASVVRSATAIPHLSPGKSVRLQVGLALDVRSVDELDRAIGRLGQDPGTAEVLAVAYPQGHARTAANRMVVTRTIAVRLEPGTNVETIIAGSGTELIRPLGYLPNTYLLHTRTGGALAAIATADQIGRQPGVRWAEAQIERQDATKATTPNDPFYGLQWQLYNTGQFGGGSGNDINVRQVWDTYRGSGINIAIVDDGLQVAHPDLAANCRTDIDIDINDGDGDPSPVAAGDCHGTFVAGCAAACGNNGIGTVGVAFQAGLVGIRLNGGPRTDAQAAQAMLHQSEPIVASDRVHVSSNSWGVADDGIIIGGPGSAMQDGLDDGVRLGRGGRGICYVWAAGNGHAAGDNANYDGFLNHDTIPVGAIDPFGMQASYSELGCNLHVAAPGGDFGGYGIVSTDRSGTDGYTAGDYIFPTDDKVGTSFAAPLVSGVVALMLQTNPSLTWRDVQHILALTSRQNDPGGNAATWITNGGGYHYSHAYGFGLINAQAAVAKALTWGNVPEQTSDVIATMSSPIAIPDFGSGNVVWNHPCSTASGFIVETVELAVDITHSCRGDLRFSITSPQGSTATMFRRPGDTSANLFMVFSSRVHWGENPNGTWIIQVFDDAGGDTGAVNALGLRIRGFLKPPVPTLTSLSLTGFATGSGATTITALGSGFAADSSGASLTQVVWNGTALATTFIDSTHVSAIIPAGYLSTPGTFSIDLRNPAIELANGSTGGGTSGPIAVAVAAGPTISAISSGSMYRNTTEFDSFTIGDADTPVDDLVVSVVSSNTFLIPNANCILGGSGASRTITIIPTFGATGSSTITISVSDGSTTTQTTFVATVIAPSGSTDGGGGGGGGGGCGAGTASAAGVLLLLSLHRLRRQRRNHELCR